MSRSTPRERFMFGCLLVALSIGIFATKVWVMGVEKRLDKSTANYWISVRTDKKQNNVLDSHERRIRETEHISWAVWDHHAPCDGFPTQQQIARGRDDE
ncbi:hypothetical protein LCGC14_2878750 [marine sediment metagenome]|uniref:Uncharacterized protein n=1 Tax=marine sediment metagenome TaxID=412755 RepID=A0A0F8Y107_9ZZZZ